MRAARWAGALASLILLLCLLTVRAESNLLEPEQAFRFSARLISPRLIEVRYQVADGYYLYKSKFAFRPEPSSVRFGPVQLPAGAWHEDEFFGRSEIYRDGVTIRIALEADAPRRFDLVVVSQGCADVGVCYLPTTHRASLVNLPGAGAASPAQ